MVWVCVGVVWGVCECVCDTYLHSRKATHTRAYIHARTCHFPSEGHMKICIVLVCACVPLARTRVRACTCACACARNFVQQNRRYFDSTTRLIEEVSISRRNIWFRVALPLWCHSGSHMIIICANALKYSNIWKCMKMYENDHLLKCDDVRK